MMCVCVCGDECNVSEVVDVIYYLMKIHYGHGFE